MDQKDFTNREKRFEVNEMVGFDAVGCRAGNDESQFHADVVDFSRRGIKLNLPFCARFNEVLILGLVFEGSEELDYTGKCRVRHMRNLNEQLWQVGCSLDPPLPQETIEHLAKSTDQERRQFARLSLAGDGIVRRQATSEFCDAHATNMSRGGFCLLVDTEFEIGEMIDFVACCEAGVEHRIAAKVRWVEQKGEQLFAGCSFIDPDSYNSLTACFDVTDNSSLASQLSDVVGWKTVAAAFIALLLPSISCFLLGSSANENEKQQLASMTGAESAIVIPIEKSSGLSAPADNQEQADESTTSQASIVQNENETESNSEGADSQSKFQSQLPELPEGSAALANQEATAQEQPATAPTVALKTDSSPVEEPVSPQPATSRRKVSHVVLSDTEDRSVSGSKRPASVRQKFDRGIRIPSVLRTGVVDRDADVRNAKRSSPVFVPSEPIK